jgi:hypothetical protein
MATFNYFKAKEFGYSDAEIADHLAKDKTDFNVAKARELGYSDKEIIGHLAYGLDPNTTTSGKAVKKGLTQGFSDLQTGFEQLKDSPTMTGKFFDPIFRLRDSITGALGAKPETPEQRAEMRSQNIRDEFEYEMFKDQGYKLESMGGYGVGTAANPVNWIGGAGGVVPKVMTLAKEAAVLGGIQGIMNPVYEEDTDGGRVKSGAIGVSIGFLTGFGLGKLFFGKAEKEAAAAAKAAKAAKDGIPTPKTEPGSGMADELGKASTKQAEEVVPSGASDQIIPDTFKQNDQNIPTSRVDEAGVPLPSTGAADGFVDPYSFTFDPKVQGSPKPKLGKYSLEFESDLDKALYIIGNRKELSKADDKFIDWLKNATGKTTEEILQLAQKAKQQRNVVVDEANKVARVERSNLPDLLPPQQQTASSIVTPVTTKPTPENPFPNLVKETPPYIGQTASVFANNTNAWNSLDKVSQNLYNIGRKLSEAESLGVRPAIRSPDYEQAGRLMKEMFPKDTAAEMVSKLKSYADFVDDLGRSMGDDFTPPSLSRMVKGELDEIYWQKMFKEGEFDGCNLL